MSNSKLEQSKLEKWLKTYGDAWEARSADKVIGAFTPDATYQVEPFSPPHEGHQGIAAYWEAATATQRNIHFKSVVWSVIENVAIVHWSTELADYGDAARKAGAAFDESAADASSRKFVELDGVFRLEFANPTAESLLCSSLREWWSVRVS